MERNRWETAIRCLEVALHPNTDDDEVIAGVNGFRRTADGAPLSEICSALAAEAGPPASAAESERLARENLDLRRQATAAEQRIRTLEEESFAAEERANTAKRELAEFRAAYGRLLDRVNRDNADLRGALEQARQGDAPRPQEAPTPFRKFLAAAQRGADRAEPVIRRSRTPGASPETAAPSSFDPRRPWMA